MASRTFDTDEVIDMLSSDDSDMEIDDEESDLFESDMELSLDGSSDDDDIDDGSTSDDDAQSSGWRAWRANDTDFPHHSFTANNVGPNLQSTPESELECFQNFITDELLIEIVVATNAFATIRISNRHFTKNSVWHAWKDLTLLELKAYIGVVLKMALVEKPDVKDYFSRKWTEYCPFFLDVFSRRRFLQIHWMLHVQPPVPSTAPVTRGSKMKNFVAYIQNKCLQNFTPSQNVARVYVLSDSATGYVSTFEPYFGQATTDALSRPDMSFTTRIVLHLVEKLLAKAGGSGYHVCTDRFYTSFTLARQLLQSGVHLTGTVMKNRVGLPPEIKSLRLRNLEMKVYRHSDNVMALGWQDRRLILMLSTWHNGDTAPHHRWRKGNQEDVEKPVVISDYTAHMGAVDRSDHYCSSYSFTRKTLKWWRKLFFWLIEVSLVNSFLMYKEVHQTRKVNEDDQVDMMLPSD